MTLLQGLRAYFPNNRATTAPTPSQPAADEQQQRSAKSGAARRRQRREADTTAGISAAEGKGMCCDKRDCGLGSTIDGIYRITAHVDP